MDALPELLHAPDPLAPYQAESERYLRSAKSANTIKAYQSDWRAFQKFCGERGLVTLPAIAGTLAAYAAHAARTLKAGTVERH